MTAAIPLKIEELTMTSLTITRPDDWHLHVRDGDVLGTVVAHTARQFARAIIMPNLKPPITTAAQALAYRDRIRAQAGAVHFVFLEGQFELISQRMARRAGHYMQPQMLESQFRTLERPTADETDVITLPVTEPVSQLVDEAISALPIHRSLPASL